MATAEILKTENQPSKIENCPTLPISSFHDSFAGRLARTNTGLAAPRPARGPELVEWAASNGALDYQISALVF